MPGEQYTEWTPKKQEQFLAKLRSGHTATAAAKACKMSRSAAYKHRKADEAFAAEWDEATAEGAEVLEEEAIRRATRGVKREKLHFHLGEVIKGEDGKPIKTIETEYSDTLLIFLLKGRKPETYRDNVKHTLAGDPDAPLTFEVRPIDYRAAVAPLAPSAEAAG
jgi:hypothetical protein